MCKALVANVFRDNTLTHFLVRYRGEANVMMMYVLANSFLVPVDKNTTKIIPNIHRPHERPHDNKCQPRVNRPINEPHSRL